MLRQTGMEQDWKALQEQKISVLLQSWARKTEDRRKAKEGGNIAPLVGDLEKLLRLLQSQPLEKWERFTVSVEMLLNFAEDLLAQKPPGNGVDEAAYAFHNQFLEFFNKFESSALDT